jgi:predicted metalloendopeptidase
MAGLKASSHCGRQANHDANLTLDRLPAGAETSWDNVTYNSPALGYVVATHQSLASHRDRSVWTYYWALAGGAPSRRRSIAACGRRTAC